MQDPITRREFVAATALLTASALAGCTPDAGGSSDNGSTPVDTPSTTYKGDGTMSKRILVGYATGTGYTTGVAEAIGKTLSERGFDVDVRPMKDQPSVSGYDAVVLGSAVNGAQWLPEATRYAETHGQELSAVPTALFCVHAMNTGGTEKKQQKREAYLDKVREHITPCAEGYFAGKGPDDKDGAFARFMFKAFGGDVEGDGRDWAEIAAWAQRLPV